MVEQMEFVDVEGIMSEIRTQIKERGYTKKDLKFADMNTSAVLGAEDYYDYPNFRATLEQVDGKRYVPWWNPIKGNKVVVFIKRFIRKCVTGCTERIESVYGIGTGTDRRKVRAGTGL